MELNIKCYAGSYKDEELKQYKMPVNDYTLTATKQEILLLHKITECILSDETIKSACNGFIEHDEHDNKKHIMINVIIPD